MRLPTQHNLLFSIVFGIFSLWFANLAVAQDPPLQFGHPEQSASANQSPTDVSPHLRYRLTNQFLGEGRSLVTYSDGDNDRPGEPALDRVFHKSPPLHVIGPCLELRTTVCTHIRCAKAVQFPVARKKGIGCPSSRPIPMLPRTGITESTPRRRDLPDHLGQKDRRCRSAGRASSSGPRWLSCR